MKNKKICGIFYALHFILKLNCDLIFVVFLFRHLLEVLLASSRYKVNMYNFLVFLICSQ